MESKGILAMLLVLVLPLSGCAGFGDNGNDETHDHDDHDHGDCPDAGTGSDAMQDADDADSNATAFVLPIDLMQANETSEENGTLQTTAATDCPDVGGIVDDANQTVSDVPNELPVGVLTLTKADGTVMGPYDSILPGETITFSAAGTTDPDGSVDLVGLTVKDANSTRTVQLYQDGAFVDQTLAFPKAGPINVTARILDSAGEGIVVYVASGVDDVFTGSGDGPLYDPSSTGCRPAVDSGSASILGNQFIADGTFTVSNGAQWISVTATGARHIALCDGDNSKLAGGSNAAETDNGEWAVGSGYKAVAYPTAGATASWTVTVHYVPKAPAA